MMQPFSAPVGTTLFTEGDPSDGLYLLSEGALRVVRPGPHGMAVPLATIGPGSVVGELSMLGAGRRTATILIAREARGWHLDRHALEVLRADLRPGAVALVRRLGALAARRVATRYEAIAAELGVAPAAGTFAGALPEAAEEPHELEHLTTTLMFARMSRASAA